MSEQEMAQVAEKIAPHIAKLSDDQQEQWQATFCAAIDEGVSMDQAIEAANLLVK